MNLNKLVFTVAILLSMANGVSQNGTKQCLDSIVTNQGGKYVFSYDSRGNIILEYLYSLDNATNDWKKYGKNEYTYDNDDNRIMEIQYTWDNVKNDWKNNRKYEFTYDNNGNRIMRIHYNLMNAANDNDWKKAGKHEFTYDNNGNLSYYILYSWNNDTNDWEKSSKYEFPSYDNNGNQTMYIAYTWNNDTNDWKEIFKIKYENTYDNDDNQIMEIAYRWDNPNDNDWKKSGKREFTYDNNGNQTMYSSYSWDNVTNDWKGNFKYEYTYDLSYSITELICGHYSWNNMRTEEKYYNWNGTDDWNINNITTYYWSSQEVTGIIPNPEKVGKLLVYPNPVSNQLQLQHGLAESTEYIIFNIMGQVLIQGTCSENGINVETLSQGVYYVKIGGGMVKFVKK